MSEKRLGLRKAKKYDWKDSNLALFGSDVEKQVKKEAAETEPAWQGCGQEPGLKIWRIVNFKVTDWPKADYGKFYSGDSYIVLHTYKPDPDSEKLAWDIHFWIGKYSTQDEYGTVAYKAVELDTFFNDAAIQHREIQGRESALFNSYFKTIVIQEGGAESGFNHVTPEEYESRLLHFSGHRKNIVIKEVALNKASLNSTDVFILDQGKMLYQWNGSGCNKDERFKAMQYLNELKSERGAESETVDEDGLSESHPFYEALTGEEEEADDDTDVAGVKALLRVSDAEGSLKMEQIKEGDVSMEDLQSADVFIIDVGNECFVWVGSGASAAEKKNGMTYAHTHLKNTGHPYVPVTVIKEGQHSDALLECLAMAA